MHAVAAISNSAIFVNLETGATTSTVYTGSVGDIEFSHDGQYAFVSNFNAAVIDVATQTLLKTMPYAACVDAAASPVELRAVAINNRFGESIHCYGIDGASAEFEGAAVSGEPAEGDAPSAVDISPDGTLAVCCNVVSGNASIIDLIAGEVRSYIDVGPRPKDVRITPDGKYALVCAMDANAVVIIDLDTDTVVKEILIYERPARVRISPDSQYAYVLNVKGTDRITFIAIDGEDSYIIKQLPAGQCGVANGYSFTETSGIELSSDESLLAVCDSFNDYLRLFNTVTQKQIAQVGVGDSPIRAGFSPAGDRVYITNAFSDSVSVVEFDGSVWKNIATIPNIDMPLTVDVDATGSYVYVGNASSISGIRAVDTTTFSTVKTLSFPDGYPRDTYLSLTDSVL